MTCIAQILALTEAFTKATGLEAKTVSWRVFGDSKKLAAVAAGADLSTRRFEAAVAWFSANWPVDADWPASVKRPAVAA